MNLWIIIIETFSLSDSAQKLGWILTFSQLEFQIVKITKKKGHSAKSFKETPPFFLKGHVL